MFEAAKKVPSLKLPCVWFPHSLMGISTSDILEDTNKGAFGPFVGQYFVADQGHSKVMRMFLEKVKGEWGQSLKRFQWAKPSLSDLYFDLTGKDLV